MCEGSQWVLLDAEDGTQLDDHGRDCHVGLRYEWDSGEMDETCDGKDPEDGAVHQDWTIEDNRLEAIPMINDGDISGGIYDCQDWRRDFPAPFDGTNVLFVQDIGTEHFLIVSEQWAGMV